MGNERRWRKKVSRNVMAISMVAKQTFSSECKYGNWGTLLKSSSGYIWINKLIQKHIGFVSNVCLFYSIHHHFEQKYAEMYFVTTVKVIVVPTHTHPGTAHIPMIHIISLTKCHIASYSLRMFDVGNQNKKISYEMWEHEFHQ